MDPLVVNIQKFCIHDGDGIRTTVFFKGCPLSCSWCHNPETQAFAPQLLYYAERCALCGACVPACPKGCIRVADGHVLTDRRDCAGCGLCANACGYGAREVAGKPYTAEALAELLQRDRIFFDNSGGGVTLSGGEPLAQDTDYLLALLARLARRGVHVAVDTCGDVPWANIAPLLPYIGQFLFDLKSCDPALHLAFTGRDNARILDNLARLSQNGARIELRIPVIGGFNADPAQMDGIIAFAKTVRVQSVHLLPYHEVGRDKWNRLGQDVPDGAFWTPSPQALSALQENWKRQGFTKVEIGG